jgi:tetratricopeptide (TPR) repeat protein
MSEAPFDFPQAHRWFAMAANNRAWDLVEVSSRSSAEINEMLDAAHAAAWHWRQVGKPINELRAQNLLATAYVAAGLGDAAVRHAEKCLELSRTIGSEQMPFDRATAHGCASLAYHCAGDFAKAADQYALACEAAELLSDAEDRSVFERLYPRL